jgi:hypothetical protein
MTELRKYRKGTKNYYRLLQVPYEALNSKNHHQCVGCALDDLTHPERPSCVERKKDRMGCQDFIPADTFLAEQFIDYIYVPATKQGLADYMKHRLEYA